VRHQLAIYYHARRYVHGVAPFRHVFVGVIAHVGILEGAPAAQQYPALAYFFVARQRFIEEVEEVVMERDHFLHELHVLHQPNHIVGEKLDGGHGPHAAGIEG
jgi:hypothetical protein